MSEFLGNLIYDFCLVSHLRTNIFQEEIKDAATNYLNDLEFGNSYTILGKSKAIYLSFNMF